VPTDAIREALATYEGVENRFTISRGGGVTIVKDYISHPTGIQKVLESAVPMAEGKVYSVFKPYRYTLIDYLKDEYGQAFQGSDEVLLTKMYAADEDPIPGVDTMTMVEKVRENDLDCTYIPDEDDIKGELHDRVQPGDLVIFFGGDDFFQMAEEFEAELAQRAARTKPEDDQPKVDGPLAE
jgi:UDP-N-acetylmuramate--alanine ligase